MDARTRAAIRERGISVWLKADLDVLVKRVRRRSDRPLLKQGDPNRILSQLMEQRDPVYAEADLTVESGDGPHDAVVQEIVRRLTDYLAAGRPATDAAAGAPR